MVANITKYNILESFFKLKKYCEKESFKGWDPYDGLNSSFFKNLPLRHWDLARLVWIQGFKRSSFNFRRVFGVPKEHNAKGIALFLTAYCNLYRIIDNNPHFDKEDCLKQINELAKLLIEHCEAGLTTYFLDRNNREIEINLT